MLRTKYYFLGGRRSETTLNTAAADESSGLTCEHLADEERAATYSASLKMLLPSCLSVVGLSTRALGTAVCVHPGRCIYSGVNI